MTHASVLDGAIMARVQAVLPRAHVLLAPPAPPSKPASLDVAVWLYHVEPVSAAVAPRRPDDAHDAPPPLMLRLDYLLCPSSQSVAGAHDAMVQIAAALHASPVLTLPATAESATPVTVALQVDALPVDRLTAIWATLGAVPLRPALAVSARIAVA